MMTSKLLTGVVAAFGLSVGAAALIAARRPEYGCRVAPDRRTSDCPGERKVSRWGARPLAYWCADVAVMTVRSIKAIARGVKLMSAPLTSRHGWWKPMAAYDWR